jgi:hypothetical protein
LDETTKPRHILLSQNLNKRCLQLIILLQGILKELHSFKRASEAFLKVNTSQPRFILPHAGTCLQYEECAKIPTRHLPLTLRTSDLFLALRNGRVQSKE